MSFTAEFWGMLPPEDPVTAPAVRRVPIHREAARALPQPQQAIQHTQPVLTVEIEPDYWSGGHFYEGTKSWINPANVWALPIGTKLYADPTPTPPAPCSGEPYVG